MKLAAYVDADVYVLPSRYETFPTTILEAYACGKPVIASNIGGLKDMVIDRETGLLFQTGNAKDLARKILYALTHPEEIVHMGYEARKLVEQKFSIDRIVTVLEKLYVSVLREYDPRK